MLWRASEITGYAIEGIDGHVGSIHDLLFSHDDWRLRWLVVDTGKWLPGRKIVVPIHVADKPNAVRKEIVVELSLQQATQSPDIDVSGPVSRQAEATLYQHYGWPPYWDGTPDHADPLRGVHQVLGLHIQATDHAVGHVDDFLVSDDDWSLRYMVADTRNWLPGRKVLVAPRWIGDIHWEKRDVAVKLTREQVRNGPPYDPSVASIVIDPSEEEGLERVDPFPVGSGKPGA